MKLNLKSPSTTYFLCLIVTFLSSCSKDSDLLLDYVISDSPDLSSMALLMDDRYFIGKGQPSMILDVLNNDTFGENAQVTIVGTSSPQYGNVVINTNNTLTYTPQGSGGTATNTGSTDTDSAPATNAPVPAPSEDPTQESDIPAQEEGPDTETITAEEDSFTYVTEVTTPDNTTLREEATVTISTSDMGELLAFPEAEGFGKYTTGGRGGRVIHVTNLKDSGPGSLREALERKGSRIVVFDVGGNIKLNSGVYIGSANFNNNVARENVTIAGETAPFPGITLTGAHLSVYCSNVIIRYLTVRANAEGSEEDALRIRNWGTGGYIQKNVMIDHLSLSHGDDENVEFWGASSTARLTDITIQNSIVGKGIGPYNHLIGPFVYNTSIYSNYFSHESGRSIFFGYGFDGQNSEMVNNIVYGYEGATNIAYGNKVDLMGNIFKAFSNKTPKYRAVSYEPNRFNNPNGSESEGALYVENNFFVDPMPAKYQSSVEQYGKSSRLNRVY